MEFDRHGWWITGNVGDTLFTGLYPPNGEKALGGGFVSPASSLHPGGVNVLMADGSARFVKETIQSWPIDAATTDPVGSTFSESGYWVGLPPPGVWQALSTRNGGELTTSADY